MNKKVRKKIMERKTRKRNGLKEEMICTIKEENNEEPERERQRRKQQEKMINNIIKKTKYAKKKEEMKLVKGTDSKEEEMIPDIKDEHNDEPEKEGKRRKQGENDK